MTLNDTAIDLRAEIDTWQIETFHATKWVVLWLGDWPWLLNTTMSYVIFLLMGIWNTGNILVTLKVMIQLIIDRHTRTLIWLRLKKP